MNVWKQFERLAGKSELKVGTVLGVVGNESILSDHGGNHFRAIGTSVSVGNKAYVKDGAITGSAPALPDVGVIWV